MLSLIHTLNQWPFWLTWIIQLLFCYSAVLVMMRLLGQNGIYVFMAVMVIAGNIQVTKLVNFPFYDNPVPLGTTLFAATYLATDILTEYYGAAAARRGILLAFSGMVLMVITMVLTLGFTPLTMLQSIQAGMPEATDSQKALLTIFTPAPALLLASLSSFLISQFTDVWIFSLIKRLTHQKWLWLRNNLSCWLSALLDNTVFSLLAWRLFSSSPVPWHTLILGYILGTYLLRVIISAMNTPFIYLAAKQLRPQTHDLQA